MNNFEKHDNHDRRAAFTSVHFGHDEPVLEVELNEMQMLQDEARRDVVRKAIPSGFTERVRAGFRGEPFVYTPQSNGLIIRNAMLIAPCKAMVNGHEVNVAGDFLYDKLPDYVKVDLGQAPESGDRDSLVYLEVWFESIPGNQPVPINGYADAIDDQSFIGTPAMDERVGMETSRRIGLRWAVRVHNECNFAAYPEGLGYTDVLNYSAVFAQAGGQLGTLPNVNTVFAPATSQLFRDEPFFGDVGLYVAGRPDYMPPGTSTLYGKYVFALPMLRIRRRNTGAWSLANPNGGPSYNQMLVVNDSSVTGDLLNGMRPDRRAHDVIDPTDVVDLRKTVSMTGFNAEHLADETVQAVFNGSLATREGLRTRRVQFGNPAWAAESLDNAKLVVRYDNTVKPLKPTWDPADPIIVEDENAEYVDSVSGSGLVLRGGREYVYRVRPNADNALLTTQDGTIDFFMCPTWHGGDDCSQTIIRLVNESGSPVITLCKENQEFVLAQRNYEESANNPSYAVSRAVMDLKSDLLVARRFVHVRISWTAEPIPMNGQLFLYVNGQLKSQTDFLPTQLVIDRLILGDANDDPNSSVVIDSLVAYNKHFETIASSAAYAFARNRFWPKLPKDFMSSDTLLLPQFNGVVSHLSDNAAQQTTVLTLEVVPDTDPIEFRAHMNIDKAVVSVASTVDAYTNTTIDGVWTDLGTNAPVFKPYDQTVTKLFITCTVAIDPGKGGQDMPVEVMSAGLVSYTPEEDVVNYNYELAIDEEVSFCAADADEPRKVPLLRPRKVAGTEDAAYDFPNATRRHDQCWARLLYYNVSGNGTNTYDIPMHLYGYRVCGVVGCATAKILNVVKVPNEVYGEEDLKFTVHFARAILIGETVTIELATEGVSFDHDINSKTLVDTVCRCTTLSFVADGVRNEYTIPVSKDGGLLKAVFTFTDYELVNNVATGEYTQTVQVYQDGQVFYDEHGMPTAKRQYDTQAVRIPDECFDTPFITVIFNDDVKPRDGVSVQIPVMYACQLPADKLLSIWYTYAPYQGVLTAGTHHVTRTSGWTPFVTTLGTGKPLYAPIRRNIVNYLPGGMANGYMVDNSDTTLLSTMQTMNAVVDQLNGQFVLLHDAQLVRDESICTLTTALELTKNASFFQDGALSVDNVTLDMYFEDSAAPCTKYIGAWTTVIDNDTGELHLLLVGAMERLSTVVNHVRPVYGDLFRIVGRPTTRP